MKLRTIDILILLLLGLLCIGRATWGIFKDMNVDLLTSKFVTGKVVQADIIQIKEMAFRSKKYKTVFAFQLDNSQEKFAIDRGLSISNYLKTEIKTGDTIKIYYRDAINEYNTFVFQIQKGQKVLVDIKNYKTKNSKMITLLYAFGFVILGGLLVWYIHNGKKR